MTLERWWLPDTVTCPLDTMGGGGRGTRVRMLGEKERTHMPPRHAMGSEEGR